MALGLGVGAGLGPTTVLASGGGGSTTIWSAANSSAGYAITGSGLIATRSTGTGEAVVKGSVGHTGTGDWDFTISFGAGGGKVVGLCTAAYPTNDWVGDQAGSVSWDNGSAQLFLDGAPVATVGNYGAGNSVRVKLKNNKVYFGSVSGGVTTWKNSADPVAETGGTTATTGSLFPACSTSATGTAYTADFTNWP